MENRRVLIADDDLDDIELLTDAIFQYSASTVIDFVIDGQKLLDKLNSNYKFDILVLDLNMPCTDGKQCLSEIRANSTFDDITIIIYSTDSRLRIKEECLKLGADYFVSKPSDVTAMMTVAEAIGKGDFTILR